MRRRSQRGTFYEFAPAFVVFVCFLVVPLVDMAAIPVRYFLAQGVLSSIAQKLALAESRSEATTIANDAGWQNFLSSCGVHVHPRPLKLLVCGKTAGDQIALDPGVPVPPAYLPNGSKAPCVYSMELAMDADLPPVYPAGTVTVKLACRSSWENMGRNPATRQYYINE